MAGKKDIVEQALKLIFSGSKAVDEAGVPVRYYHGTTKDLPVIKPGTYFTEDPREGSAYTFWTDLKNAEKHKGKYSVISAPELAGKRLEYFGTISDIDSPKVGEFYATDNGIMRYKGNGIWDVASDVGIDSGSLDMSDYTIGIKPYDNSEAAKRMVDEYEEAVNQAYPGGIGGNVIPAYLNVKNPKEMPPLEGNRFGERLGADPKWVADEIERLKAQGYDSIVTTSDDPFYAMEGRKPPKQYMIFEPTQAKSAIGNTGEYDFTNPDINKASGGSIREGYGPGGWVDDIVKMAGKIMGAGEEVAPVSRIGLNYKDVTKRVPELTEAAKRLQAGEIGQSEYSAMVDRFKPVEPYASVPDPASVDDMVRALTANKREKIGKLADYPEGHPVALRLDIPAYTGHGVWVPTIHDQKTFKSISHEPAAHIAGAQFSIPENKALAVAAGGAKGPFATIDGSLLKTPPEAIHERAKAAMSDPDWVQVGMDPERHSYFYDRKTMQPVLSAEEVIQVGPLVLARKPVYGNAEGFKYSKGGSARYGNNSISGALNVARGLNGGE